MIIPIFIPRYTECGDSDNKHGSGCKCPNCLEEEKWANAPREYYKYKYAVPSSFIIKNRLFSIMCWAIALIGVFLIVSPIVFIEHMTTHFWLVPLNIILGCGIVIVAYRVSYKLVEYDFNCKQGIYIEIRDSYINPEKWEDKIKELDIPKGYWLTKETESWRYMRR